MASHPIDYRYGSKEMKLVWDEATRFEYYLKVEVALAKALAKTKAIGEADATAIEKAAKSVKIERIKKLEQDTRHDVMAVAKALAEQSTGEAGRFVHLTATSNDIVDTAQALQLKQALEIIVAKTALLRKALGKQAVAHESTVMAGRTHGQHALPITLGFKLANYLEKIGCDEDALRRDLRENVRAKFSGAVGTYASQKLYGIEGTKLEEKIVDELGLEATPISTQVTQRENNARIVSDLAVLAGTLEQMAKEVRNLQRTEIGELAEPFSEGQVGSSTMAQKKNPVDCENVCSNARVVRSCVAVAMENIALEHERDLTNSASERSLLPTAFILVDEMLSRMTGVVEGLVVNKERMRENLALTRGTIMAEAIITELVKKGVGRQEAHAILQKASAKAVEEKTELRNVLERDSIVSSKLSKKEVEALLDYESYLGLAKEKTREIVKKRG